MEFNLVCGNGYFSRIDMEFIIPTIFILIVVAHALIDAYQIEKKGIYINHFKEGCYYALVCVVVSFVLWKLGNHWLSLAIFPLITRMAFFDGLLNLFRGKKFLYEGKASLVDRIERAIGLPTWFMRMFYFAAYIVYLIIYFV